MQVPSTLRLFETMKVDRGEVYRLDRHLDRLKSSAALFGFPFSSERVWRTILARANGENGPGRMRLLLNSKGAIEIEVVPYPLEFPKDLRLSKRRVDSQSIFLRHKTTDRQVYEGSDVILINERGEVTETGIANIAVFREKSWCTPPLSSGLLPGVMRAELLDRGEIRERLICADELANGELVRCFNSLRGVFDVPFHR